MSQQNGQNSNRPPSQPNSPGFTYPSPNIGTLAEDPYQFVDIPENTDAPPLLNLNSTLNAAPRTPPQASNQAPHDNRGENIRNDVSPRTQRSRQIMNDLMSLIDLFEFAPIGQGAIVPERENNETEYEYMQRLQHFVLEGIESNPNVNPEVIQRLRAEMQVTVDESSTRASTNESIPEPGLFHHEEQNLFYGDDQNIPQESLPQFVPQNNFVHYFPGVNDPFLGVVDMVDDAIALATQQYFFQNPVQQNVLQGGQQSFIQPQLPVPNAPFVPNSTFDFDMNYGQNPALSSGQIGQGPPELQNFSAGPFIPPLNVPPQLVYQEPPNVFDDLPGPAYGYNAIPDLPSPGFSHGFSNDEADFRNLLQDEDVNMDRQDNNNDDLNQFFQSPVPAPAPARFPTLAPAPTPAQAPAPAQFPTLAPVPAPAPARFPALAPAPIVVRVPANNNTFVPNTNDPRYDWSSSSPSVAVWAGCTYSGDEIQRARNLGTFPFIYPSSIDPNNPNTWPDTVVRCEACYRGHKTCTVRETGRPCNRCGRLHLECDVSRYFHVNYTGRSINRSRKRKDDDGNGGNGRGGPATKRQRTEGGNSQLGGKDAAARGTSAGGQTVTTGGQSFSKGGKSVYGYGGKSTQADTITSPTQTYTITRKPLARAPNKQEAANPQPNVRHAGLGFYVDDGPAHPNETAAEADDRQKLARENMNIELKTIRTPGMSNIAYARAEADRRLRNSQRREAARRFVNEFCDQNGYDRPAENPNGYDSADHDSEDDEDDDDQDENEVHLRGGSGSTAVIASSGGLGSGGLGSGGPGSGANKLGQKPQPCTRCAGAPFKAPGRCSLVLNPGSQPACVKCAADGVPHLCVRREPPGGPRVPTKRKRPEAQEGPRKKPAIPAIPTFSSLPADTRSSYGDRTAAPTPRPAAAGNRNRGTRAAPIGNIPCSYRCGRTFAPDDDESRLDHEMQCDRAPQTQESGGIGSWNHVPVGTTRPTVEDQFNALSQQASTAPRTTPAGTRTRAAAPAPTKPKMGAEPPLFFPPAAENDRCWECQRLDRVCGGRFTGPATWPICRPCFDAGRADFCMWGEQLEAAVDQHTRALYVRRDIVDPAKETLVTFNYRRRFAKMYSIRSGDLLDLRQNEFITLDAPPYSIPLPDTRLLVGINPINPQTIPRPSPDNPPAIGPLSGIPVPAQIAQINNGADFLKFCKELRLQLPMDPDRIHTEHEYVYYSCRPQIQKMNLCRERPAKTCDTTPHRRFSPDFNSCGDCNTEQRSYQLGPQRDVVNKTKHHVCSTHAKAILDDLISPGDMGELARRNVKWNHCICTQQTIFSWLCNMDRNAAMNQVRSRTLLFNEYLIKKGWDIEICGAAINDQGTPQNNLSCFQRGASTTLMVYRSGTVDHVVIS